ncbi:MAG: hypothetical protein OHK0056_31150 [Bacteriovoracaceae bacterium]
MTKSLSQKLSTDVLSKTLTYADARLNRLYCALKLLGIFVTDHEGFISFRIKTYQVILRSMELINFEELDLEDQKGIRIEIANGRIFVVIKDNVLLKDIYSEKKNIIHLLQVSDILEAFKKLEAPEVKHVLAVNTFLNNFREIGISLPIITEKK